MTRPFIPKFVREKVTVEAGYRCGYCLTPQEFTAMPMHVEHIIPYAAGGPLTEGQSLAGLSIVQRSKGCGSMALTPKTVNECPSLIRAVRSGANTLIGARMASLSLGEPLADVLRSPLSSSIMSIW